MFPATLRQLRYFEAVARLGHFGRAAEACTISQPALSMQIKELEEALGSALVERATRQVRLTPLGEDVARRAAGILRAVDELDEAARAARGPLSGRLGIGIIPTIAPYLLPALTARLARTHPALDLHVREAITSRLIEDVAEGGLDAAILALPVSSPALTEMALFTEAFVLVRPAADAALPVPDQAALRAMKLLLLEEGHCFRNQALAFCAPNGARPQAVMEASSLTTLVAMVGAGLGVTLIPDMAVPLETRSAEVAAARFPTPEPTRTVGMVWRRSSPLAGQYRELAEAVAVAAGHVHCPAAAPPAKN